MLDLRMQPAYRVGTRLFRVALVDGVVLIGTALGTYQSWLPHQVGVTVVLWMLLIWFVAGFIGILLIGGSILAASVTVGGRLAPREATNLIGSIVRDLVVPLPRRSRSEALQSIDNQMRAEVENVVVGLAKRMQSRLPELWFEFRDTKSLESGDWSCFFGVSIDPNDVRMVLRVWLTPEHGGRVLNCAIIGRDGAVVASQALGRVDRAGGWKGSLSYMAEFLDNNTKYIEREISAES